VPGPQVPEWVFRAAALGVLLAYVPAGLYFRLRAARSRESLDRRQEGWAILVGLRLAGLLMVAATVSYLARPALVQWAQWPLSPILRWLGLPLGLAGALLFVWTLATLGSNLTDTVVTRREHALVIEGPYRWVRHPFYLSALAGGLGMGLLAASPLIAGATVGVYALLVLRTPNEERHLAARFGVAYEEYRRRVPPFWPRWPGR